MKIYLAGGIKSGWQSKVMESAPEHTYFNPATDADQKYPYRWNQSEIDAIKGCDYIFAYFEKDNPSGLGMAKEIGLAIAQDIPVIFIDEHDRMNEDLCACSRRVYSKLEPAIEYLKHLVANQSVQD